MPDQPGTNIPPREIVEDEDGILWERVIDDDAYVQLGIAPAPTTVWQTFVYHLCHGIIMHYSLWSVVTWSWRNRRSFIDPPEVIELNSEDAE